MVPAMGAITPGCKDPLGAVWIAAADRIGLRVARREGASAPNHVARGQDDVLARSLFHELCRSLVQGHEPLAGEDPGSHDESHGDAGRGHACLRLQAALSAPWGLRWVLGPAPGDRAYYDALPPDPLSPRDDPAAVEARLALRRAQSEPWSPHLARALEATALIVRAAVQAGAGEASLFALAEPPAERHPLGFFVGVTDARCGDCGWCFRGGRGKPVERCRHAAGARVDPAWPACERFERPAEIDCLSCGACCREAYGAVVLSPRDPMARAHPDLVERDGATRLVRREGDRCAALEVGDDYRCRIYPDRPRTCRDFERAGEHCLTARRRVGLS